jgi:secreted trypsin-like serine protease
MHLYDIISAENVGTTALNEISQIYCLTTIGYHIFIFKVLDRKQWPWMSSFRGAGGQCSGAIIGDQFLITAAHCCEFNIIGRELITGTLSSFGDAEIPKEESVFTIIDFQKHENFNSENNLSNDICILKVDREFQFTERVYPVCFSNAAPAVGTKAYLAGWGVTSENSDDLVETFREVMVPIADEEICKEKYQD